jgi:hypothetical protein
VQCVCAQELVKTFIRWSSFPFNHPYRTARNPLSGWTDSDPHDSTNYEKGGDQDHDWWHYKSAGFVSGYAEQNPLEDFAESFSQYFMDRVFGTTQIANAAPLKQAFIDNFVNGL